MRKLLFGVLALSASFALAGCSGNGSSNFILDEDKTTVLGLNDKSIKTLKVPKGITAIGQLAFANCPNLEKVTISDTVETIGQSAFEDCIALKDIVIPKNVKEIGNSAFAKCEKLETVTLSEGLKKLGKSAFENCEGLTEITIPSTVTTIGSACFQSCTYLSYIDIKANLESINTYVFCGCHIKTIVIPKSIERIERYSIMDTQDINNLYYGGTKEEWNSIYMADGIKDEFKFATLYEYSESQPTEDGKYWHYTSEGRATSWK